MAAKSKPNPPEEDDAPDGMGLDGFGHAPSDEGISLDQLSAAFANLMSEGDDPYEPDKPDGGEDGEAGDAEQGPDADAEEDEQSIEAAAEGEEDECCPLTPRSILEAMLFVGHPQNEPLTNRQIASRMRGVSPQEIDLLVRDLNESYLELGCPYRIVPDDAGYRLALAEDFSALRDKFYGRVRQARLSQAAIDVLAVVAYHQPITREEADAIRGKPSGALLGQLVRRQLLLMEIEPGPPRIRRYSTTDRFLALFGLSSLDELPQAQELDAQS